MTSIENVIKGGYCVGCGACAAVASQASIRMHLEPQGWRRPTISPDAPHADLQAAAAVCPFSGLGPNEDEIGSELFPELPFHPSIGRHRANFAGWVTTDGHRDRGSSGGLATWVAENLLRNGSVDGIAHVRAAKNVEAAGPLFDYAISTDVDQIRSGAKSRYYPVEISQIQNDIEERALNRIAFIGVPCSVKAINLLKSNNKERFGKILFTISIFCGHMKSSAFAAYLAWQSGIHPDELVDIDFRYKIEGQIASRYAMRARSRCGREEIRPMAELDGGNWGLGYFKLEACDYCDDVVGETADLSVGDAWLPEYVEDWRGTNVVIVRNPVLLSLLEKGAASGELHLESLMADDVARSQAAGLAHRREGLQWRLYKKMRDGLWFPPKRVAPQRLTSVTRRRIYDMRTILARESHVAFAKARKVGRLTEVQGHMAPFVKRYHKLYQESLMRRFRGRVKRLVLELTAKKGRN